MQAPIDQNLTLFIEILESATTRDGIVASLDGGWLTRPVRPDGKGWRPAPLKVQRERHTVWVRRRASVWWPTRPNRSGGWLR